MSNLPNTKKWQNFLEDKGVSDEIIGSYLPYIEKLNENKVPVIFEITHLSLLLGIKEVELAKMIMSPDSFYRRFEIPKKSGGKREIFSPYPSLQSCQKWIYENILLKTTAHRFVHGFVRKKSTLSNAKVHLAQPALLKIDLLNFFPSIPINWVINYFFELGYAHNVAFFLASLCCVDNRLAQGASTSPYLSNILLKNLDYRLARLSRVYKLRFTRYADDMVFSGNYIPFKFIDIVKNIVEDYSLEINTKKTRLYTKPGKRIVTGLSVAGQELKLPRKYKRKLRQEIHFIKKYGYLSHIAKLKIRNPNYLESLYGKINYWLHIEPENKFAIDSKHYLQHLILHLRQ